jgi:hypothetical protein
MGGESLGTYSIEVDSASSRPCVEVWAMCAGVIVAWSPDSGSVVKRVQVCLRLGCIEERKPQTSAPAAERQPWSTPHLVKPLPN